MNNRKEREVIRTGDEGYYHLCTDGLKGGLIFNNDKQYAFGMFLMGIISIKYSLRIVAFVLMPNHIHIILYGTGANGLKAFDYLKRKITKRLSEDGLEPLPEDYGLKMVRIEGEEQMKKELVYVLRNPLEKELGTVEGYLWGSGWLYHSGLSKMLLCKRIDSLSKRSLNRLLSSEISLPPDWRIHPSIGLLPDSFIDLTTVRAVFPTPKDYQTALVKDYETYFQIANRLGEVVEFNKAERESIVNQTLQKRFNGKDLNAMTEQDKGKLAIILNRNFGFNSYQISTSIFLKERVVRQLLNSKELSR